MEGCPGGESPAAPRKRLNSTEDAWCGSRPPPEGAGSVSISESADKGGLCQQCQKKVTELKKQVLALVDQNSLKVGVITFWVIKKKRNCYCRPILDQLGVSALLLSAPVLKHPRNVNFSVIFNFKSVPLQPSRVTVHACGLACENLSF